MLPGRVQWRLTHRDASGTQYDLHKKRLKRFWRHALGLKIAFKMASFRTNPIDAGIELPFTIWRVT